MDDQGVSRNRRYTLKRRAEKQAETRRRIVEATHAFHGSLGPSRTTVADICRSAGVRRATFYRNFPDELSLFKQCRDLELERHPLPEPDACRGVAAPVARLRSGLRAAYAYYRQNEQTMAAVLRDSDVMPVGRAYLRYQERLRDVVAAAWGARGRRRARIVAACGLAVDFYAWRSMATKHYLADEEAIEVMVGAVSAAAA